MDHVLVVDDSKAINRLLSAELRELGELTVESAESYASARALLAENPQRFLLAVLDLNLPDAPNGEVVDLARGLDVPVVVLTASLDQQLRRRMFEKQVADYEVKTRGAGIERVVELVDRLRFYREALILVVDDAASTRLYIADLLERHGYNTIQAADGPEALATLKANPSIALVVTDFYMPGMNGAELTAEIRRAYPRDELGIIGISGSDKGETSIPLLKSGANDFITRPFEVEEFYARVDQNLDMLRILGETRDAANRDFLTKLYNRRYFFAIGTTLYENARRGNLALGAAVIDLDHFKQVNDTYGHDAGDLVLVEIARALQRTVRRSDLLARFGGEEFICLLNLKSEDEVKMAAERIRRYIEGTRIRFDGHNIPVTASIGVTTSLSDSLQGMLQIADEGVYQAKHAGRNRVAVS